MKRTYMAARYTDEELKNYLAGKCWCGKPHEEFQKGMRSYCSPEHREEWHAKTLTWSEFREKFLNNHGRYCDFCGKKDDDLNESRKKYEDALANILSEHRDEIEIEMHIRSLQKLDEWYESRRNDILTSKPTEYDVKDYASRHRVKLPEYNFEHKRYEYEVDHIKAIVNGGAEFDTTNLQVLCKECHREKTKNDISLRDEFYATLMPENQRRLEMENGGLK